MEYELKSTFSTVVRAEKECDVYCPICHKPIVTKKGKNRTVFYSCSGYPTCSFSSWDIPTGEKCPGCGSALLRKKGKNTVYCKSGCGYSDGK